MSNEWVGSAEARANIALTKYWGNKGGAETLANNDSISMTLGDECVARTTVRFSSEYVRDRVVLGFEGGEDVEVAGLKKDRVVDQINRFREMAGVDLCVRVLSHTSFPEGVGIASSAAGFSALTLATCEALGLKFDKKQLSIQTRWAGSGSACRSVFGGFVRWRAGETSETSYAEQIAPSDHWALRDIVVGVSRGEKKVSSLEGHRRAVKNPHYRQRLELMPGRNTQVESAILTRDFEMLAPVVEEDARDLHAIALTSNPPIIYWNGATLDLMRAVPEWRDEGVPCCYTMDAGPNVHIICEAEYEEEVLHRVSGLGVARFTFVNGPGEGARVVDDHLF